MRLSFVTVPQQDLEALARSVLRYFDGEAGLTYARSSIEEHDRALTEQGLVYQDAHLITFGLSADKSSAMCG